MVIMFYLEFEHDFKYCVKIGLQLYIKWKR